MLSLANANLFFFFLTIIHIQCSIERFGFEMLNFLWILFLLRAACTLRNEWIWDLFLKLFRSLQFTSCLSRHGSYITPSQAGCMLLWRFKLEQNKTLGMLNAQVTFQDWCSRFRTDTEPSRFLSLGTRTGLPRTHRTFKDSLRKRTLRWRNETNVPRNDTPINAKSNNSRNNR